MHVLTISLGRNILREGREQERMKLYAAHLSQLSIIVLTRKEHGYTDVVEEGNLHVYPTNSRNRFMMLVDAFRIGFRVLRVKDTDTARVVSAQDPLLIGWFAWVLSQVCDAHFHVQVHGDYFGSGWSGRSPVKRIQLFLALLLLRRAPFIRVVSKRIKDSLTQRGIPAKKITVLPIRPELEAFLPYTHVVRTTPPYTFLFIGRLAPEKDILRIVRAFALVHREHPLTHLRIVGEGSERARILGLVTSLGVRDAITLLPWTDAVGKEMAEADIFLLASLHEAYALTLVEAMAVGLPLITTDVGCVGEVVQDGIHGLVVHEMDDEAYAEAMIHMIRDTAFRTQCGTNGKETARALSESTAEEYAKAWVTALKPVS
ncbi:glycosyltransferase family 4 protein [Candidatus Kaiserbacteria bacterium]|nr:MAG: glycosyltransferase family 4 protein [Candidatus Kaiserbacteria bacterium]